jgi:hypothetical protein
MKHGQDKRRKGLNRRLVYATFLVTLILVGLLTLYYVFLLPREEDWTAALVDQLAVVPRLFAPEFNSTCTELLTASRFDAKYYAGEDVTIDFYRDLPSKGARILIIRAHSSVRANTSNVDLYTSEIYQDSLASGRYYDLAVNKHISRAYFNYSEAEYFAVGPSFISDVMNGDFHESLVILMGCKSLNQTSMADALLDRGAKVVVGWTGDITVSDTDTCALELLELLLDKSYTLQGAVNRVNDDNPLTGTRLVYHPAAEGSYVVPTRKVYASPMLSQVMLPSLAFAAVGLVPRRLLFSAGRKRSYPLTRVSTVTLGCGFANVTEVGLVFVCPVCCCGFLRSSQYLEKIK